MKQLINNTKTAENVDKLTNSQLENILNTNKKNIFISDTMKISQGAEAIIYKEKNKIIKDRIKKNYRIKEIDEKLRKFRTKREAKILSKLGAINFPVPKLININLKKNIIEMQEIKGNKVRDILEKSNYDKLCFEIGQKIAILHNNNIIHGDLTTSNIILAKEIYFIDFGLSFFSHKVEDKAVDLHLLKQALESRHYKIYEKAFRAALNGYKSKSNNYENIMKRFEIVETRGRYKNKN